MNLEIASRLLQLRKQHSLSQEELAEKLGLSRQAVSKWERAESSPDTNNLIALARLYNVSVDELLSIDGARPMEYTGDDIYESAEPEQSTPFSAGFFDSQKHEGSFEFRREDDHIIYEKSGKRSEYFNSGEHGMARTLKALYPLLVAIGYFSYGVLFGVWHPTWIAFFTIPIVEVFLSSATRGKSFTSSLKGSYPILMVVIFLMGGFFLGLWHPLWLIFLTIPIFYTIF